MVYMCLRLFGAGWKREDSTLYELAEMKFISAYPTLRVMDIVGGGGLANISKVTLRKMFCIDERVAMTIQ